MFDSPQRFTGAGHSATAGLLFAAFVLSPSVLLLAPFLASWAVACSALCVGLAWVHGTKHPAQRLASVTASSPSPQ